MRELISMWVRGRFKSYVDDYAREIVVWSLMRGFRKDFIDFFGSNMKQTDYLLFEH
jgi:hypothetical protein